MESPQRFRRYSAGEYAALGLLALWAVVPVVILIADPLAHGGTYTGAIGIDAIDQFQYLAWIRDEGVHGLSINLFGMTGGSHVYLNPMWFLSGILWRLGVGLQLAYLLWVPVAAFVMWIGAAAFARRYAGTASARTAILLLALFFCTPLGWLNLPATHWAAEAQLPMGDETPALQLWFALHTAVAIGVMPLVLLGCERLLAGARQPSRSLVCLIACGAGLVSWLHSWQGEELILVVAALAVLRAPRWDRVRILLPVLIAGCAPLLYQLLLVHTDPGWKIIEQTNDRPDLVVLTPQLAVIGPLLAAAVFGLARRRPRDDGEWALVLWPVAAVIVFRFDPEFPPHAMQGATLPLAALAVRGWPQAKGARVIGWAALAAFTIPGLAFFAKSFVPDVRASRVLYYQTASEHSALSKLATAPAPGGVLAPYPFSLEIPAFTDRPVWDGHQAWTPDYLERAVQANQLFAGQMTNSAALRFTLSTHVRWVLVDCSPQSRRVIGELAPIVASERPAGCAEVLQILAGP